MARLFQVTFIICVSLVPRSSGQFQQWFDPVRQSVQQAAGQLVGQATQYFAKTASDFARFTDRSQQIQRNFTASEVSQCTGQDNGCLYIVFNGNVLNLTDFLPFHAGGSEVLLEYAGRDASDAMRAAGMPPRVFDSLLQRFIIGRLVPDPSLLSPVVPATPPVQGIPRGPDDCGWLATSMGLCEYIVRIETIYNNYSGLIKRFFVLTRSTYNEMIKKYGCNEKKSVSFVAPNTPRTSMGEFKQYTLADVATRNGRGSNPLWVVYKDSIYDLSKYIHEHPGGHDSLHDEAGGDATRAFDDIGHSSDARQIMMQYKIGEIVEEERKYDANGKKKKRVVQAAPEKPEMRSCFNIITCGLVG